LGEREKGKLRSARRGEKDVGRGGRNSLAEGSEIELAFPAGKKAECSEIGESERIF